VKFIEKLSKSNRRDWNSNRYILAKFFDIATTTLTKEQQSFVKTIEGMEEMVEANSQTMKYINVPYRIDDYEYPEFWALMKQVLAY
jgi:hypothetical protein